MDFCYSDIVNSPDDETMKLCEGVALRMHRDTQKEVAGVKRAHDDWTKFVSPVGQYHGGLGRQYGFIAVTVPECLPERLEIISYANEFAFLYDGCCLSLGHVSGNSSRLMWEQMPWKGSISRR